MPTANSPKVRSTARARCRRGVHAQGRRSAALRGLHDRVRARFRQPDGRACALSTRACSRSAALRHRRPRQRSWRRRRSGRPRHRRDQRAGRVAWHRSPPRRGSSSGSGVSGPYPGRRGRCIASATLEAMGPREPLGDLLRGRLGRAAARRRQGSERFADAREGARAARLRPLRSDPRSRVRRRAEAPTTTRAAHRGRPVERDRPPRADEGKGRAAARSEDRAPCSTRSCPASSARVSRTWRLESGKIALGLTGWDVAPTLRSVAARVVTAKKLFQRARGLDRAEDTLPPRILEEPLVAAEHRSAPDAGGARLWCRVLPGARWDEDGSVPEEVVAVLGSR